MKKSINRNIIAAEFFVNQLCNFGVRHVCISPGSRSTPLTIAFSKKKCFRKHVMVDERSSCFYALGIAKHSNTPVAIVTTSGTAVAELYPGIIEAFYSKVPLIICTADRPYNLRNAGSNQTINQKNIFRNHIIGFFDLGLPQVEFKWFEKKREKISSKLQSVLENPGPVHFNFQFEKPLGPSEYTDTVDTVLFNDIHNEFIKKKSSFKFSTKIKRDNSARIIKNIINSKRILINCGPDYFNDSTIKDVFKIAEKFNCPIFADGLSPLKLKGHKNLIYNCTSIVKSEKFIKYYDPDFIIHFGNAPTSNSLLEFFKKSKATKILVNKYGERKDPSRTAKHILKINPADFCEKFVAQSAKQVNDRDEKWLQKIIDINNAVDKIKSKSILKKSFPFEGRIVTEVVSLTPQKSNLMISNSMPVRDFDLFVSERKKLNLFYNRGASGIDGIISTTNGIAANSKSPTTLIIGDLAFYHDLNALSVSKNLDSSLVIILINNCGGGIFDMLPIAEENIDFNRYFKTPINLDFEKIVESFEGNYFSVNGWRDLKEKYKSALGSNHLSVLEIRTNSTDSAVIRKNYWAEVIQKVDSMIDEN